jgi:hypothetical protein
MKQLFDVWDRKLILTYYRNPNVWHQKPSVVTRYELLKARKALDKSVRETKAFGFFEKVVMWLEKRLNN